MAHVEMAWIYGNPPDADSIFRRIHEPIPFLGEVHRLFFSRLVSYAPIVISNLTIFSSSASSWLSADWLFIPQ